MKVLENLQSKSLSSETNPVDYTIDMSLVTSIILSGGEGSRLNPLTLSRCKPAINFGGKYKLVDVPISNSIHANCGHIFVLTQFLSRSLHSHITKTYNQLGRHRQSIEILSAEQKPTHKSWYSGTADAVRQNLDYLLESPTEYFLILSGDQLYNIDFKEMVRFAKEKDADVVVASIVVDKTEIKRMGAIKTNASAFIVDFFEKPQTQDVLEDFIYRKDNEGKESFLGSMGIYLFKRSTLINLIKQDTREDFGKHLIPTQLKNGKIAAYIHNGYWEDIGTIKAFFEANLALTNTNPAFNFYDEKRPIFSLPHQLPPAKICKTIIENSLIDEGSIINAKKISHSLIGPRSIILDETIITDCVLMGNDYYESSLFDHSRYPVRPQIGKNCQLKNCIIDKNVLIGSNVSLLNKKKIQHLDGEHFFIREGIIIIPKGAHIPDDFVI